MLEYCAKSELDPRSGLGVLKGRKMFGGGHSFRRLRWLWQNRFTAPSAREIDVQRFYVRRSHYLTALQFLSAALSGSGITQVRGGNVSDISHFRFSLPLLKTF